MASLALCLSHSSLLLYLSTFFSFFTLSLSMALAKDPTQSIQSCSLYANFSGSSSSSSSSSSPIKVPDLSNCSGLLYAVHHEVADHTSETTHNNNGYVFQPDHFKAATGIGHGHDMFMHTSAGSLLSFVQNEGSAGVILQDSYSKTSSDDQEDEFSVWENNLNNNFVSKCSTNNGNMRLLENFNCFQTASNSNNHQNGEDMFGGLFYTEAEGATATNDGIIQEISTTHNKRPNMGESMQALKKQCTGVGATRKPKPKAVSISKDPQSIAAKNRRERISERLKTLQELVPNGSKVDLVTMLEKAISYVKFLQLQVKVLATDEFWPAQGGKAPEISQVKEAIDAILLSSSQREHRN